MFLSFQKNINTSKNPNGREVTLSFIEFKNNYLNKLKNTYPLIVMERLFEPTFDFDMLCSKGKL